MTLPEISIKRHVLAFMLSALLVLIGVIAYQRVGMDRFPYIEFPVISVTTAQKGANPEIIDASITNLIESAANSIPGIEHIQSTSSPGFSIVNITFALEKDIDVAFNEVQSKINQVLRQLPDDADPPVVAKLETNAQPILWLAIQGDRTQQQLNQYARTVLKKRLETVPGVGRVQLGGRRDRTIRVNLDPARMAAFKIGTQDVTGTFAREHALLPGGFLTSQKTEYLLKLDLEYHQTRALGDMVVAYRDNAPVFLKDIASIEDGLSDYRQLARWPGPLSKFLDQGFLALERAYRRLLDLALMHRWVVVCITLGIVLSSAWFFTRLNTELTPEEDEGRFLVYLRTPLGPVSTTRKSGLSLSKAWSPNTRRS